MYEDDHEDYSYDHLERDWDEAYEPDLDDEIYYQDEDFYNDFGVEG